MRIDPADFYDGMNASVRRRNSALEEQGGKRWEYEQRRMDSELKNNELSRMLLESRLAAQTKPENALATAPSPQVPAISSGLDSVYQTGPGMRSGGDVAPMKDAKHWTNKLRKLLTDPAAFERTPGFQAALDTGRQAIERSYAAKGMGNSGNVLAELMKYGTGLASQEYGGQVDRLARLSQYEQGNPDYWKGTPWGAA